MSTHNIGFYDDLTKIILVAGWVTQGGAGATGCSGWVPSVTIMETRCLISLCEDILHFLRKKGGSS